MRSFNYMFGNFMLFCETNFINLPISEERGSCFYHAIVFNRPLVIFILLILVCCCFKRNLGSNRLQRLPKDIFKNLNTLEEL